MTAHTPGKYFRKPIFLPQDHGSWVFLFSPLFIGLILGGKFTFTSFSLVIALIAAFRLRQPVTITVKVFTRRRPKGDLPAARFWIAVYGFIAVFALIGLLRAGFGYLLLLAIPGAPIFA